MWTGRQLGLDGRRHSGLGAWETGNESKIGRGYADSLRKEGKKDPGRPGGAMRAAGGGLGSVNLRHLPQQCSGESLEEDEPSQGEPG